MNRRGAGMAFIAIAAFLYAAHHITAAIFGSGVSSWSSDLFHRMLGYVGPSLATLSKVSLVAGIFYLAWSEIESLLAVKVRVSKAVDAYTRRS